MVRGSGSLSRSTLDARGQSMNRERRAQHASFLIIVIYIVAVRLTSHPTQVVVVVMVGPS